MKRYILQGKLYVPRVSRPINFEGSFVRNVRGTLEGRMEFDKTRGFDMRDEIYGSLTNEDSLKTPHEEMPAENHLVLFHTRNGQHIDRVYWLSEISEQDGDFNGTYNGVKEELVNPYRVQDVKDSFGWNVREILSKTQGTKVEITIKRQ
jgi:hypothetical protein